MIIPRWAQISPDAFQRSCQLGRLCLVKHTLDVESEPPSYLTVRRVILVWSWTGASRRSISRVWFQEPPGPCGSAGSGCRSNSAATRTGTEYGVVVEQARAALLTEHPHSKVRNTCVCYIREASTTSWSSHQLAKSGAARTSSSVRGGLVAHTGNYCELLLRTPYPHTWLLLICCCSASFHTSVVAWCCLIMQHAPWDPRGVDSTSVMLNFLPH
jgi:hypothetical protein